MPPVLEYLLDAVRSWPRCRFDSFAVGQKQEHCAANLRYSKMETLWPLVNELERAWTGVEERDRAVVSNLVLPSNYSFLIMVCLSPIHHIEAKRPYRDTLWSFQSQCGQVMILRWLRRKFITQA